MTTLVTVGVDAGLKTASVTSPTSAGGCERFAQQLAQQLGAASSFHAVGGLCACHRRPFPIAAEKAPSPVAPITSANSRAVMLNTSDRLVRASLTTCR